MSAPANHSITTRQDQRTPMKQTILHLAENLMTEMVMKKLTQKQATN
jgi:hypothetical protein